eukprot:TRINITY_DN7190_c0_g1_i2.p1 TRINITY_DN7190_c0_g1~~TRINITY_DN7190_c0_g1_i2.p1  ORF type:complete len:426 (+),score=123.60 TRINITY_DN7190_c0_g1_i2:248-1525(+)
MEDARSVDASDLESLFRRALEQKGNTPKQCLASDRLNHGLQVSDDSLTATHSLSGAASGGDASLQTQWPLALTCGVGYYEVLVHHCGVVVIGLANQGYPNGKQPGSKKHSCGYKSDDGQRFINNGEGTSYGPTFSSGDVVGCGFCSRTRDVWFTKNGEHLGVAFQFPTRDIVIDHIFPTVGVEQASVSVNFDFSTMKWNPEEAIAQERAKALEAVRKTEVPAKDKTADIVVSYLLHYGYHDTLQKIMDINPANSKQLLRRCDGDDDDNDECQIAASKLVERKEVIQKIMKGDILGCMKDIEELFPNLKEDVWPSLLSQLIVEHIKADKLDDAFNVTASAECSTANGEPHHLISEVVGLLAYNDPKESPLAYLLEQSQRRRVADHVNSAILTSLNYQSESVLESLLKHIMVMPVLAKECFYPISLS